MKWFIYGLLCFFLGVLASCGALQWSLDTNVTSDNIYRWHLSNTNRTESFRLYSNGVYQAHWSEPAGPATAHIQEAWIRQPSAHGITVAVLDQGEGRHLDEVVALLEATAPGVIVLRFGNAWPESGVFSQLNFALAQDPDVILFTFGVLVQYSSVSNLLRKAEADGIWVVCAAPNINNYSCDRPGYEDYPSAWGRIMTNIIGVTGFTIAGEKCFSSSTNDFHVAAPARRIQTSENLFNSGNSFASTIVAASCALMLSHGIGDLRNELMRASDVTWTGHCRSGALNVWRALGGQVLHLSIPADRILESTVDLSTWSVLARGPTNISIHCSEPMRFWRW